MNKGLRLLSAQCLETLDIRHNMEVKPMNQAGGCSCHPAIRTIIETGEEGDRIFQLRWGGGKEIHCFWCSCISTLKCLQFLQHDT